MLLNDTLLTREELSNRFSAVDYVVFAIMLLMSAGIGIFYGCFGNKMKDTKEFLMAGKSMTTFPVAMSLIASFMSAITLLGTPSEVYKNGITYWLIGISYIVVMPVTAYLFLPVFWKLQVTSAYEYLEIRFSKPVRMLGSGIFIIQMTLYMAIVVYAPALALAQVTGMNVYMSVSAICIVCMFYTTLGGMKAVLWTDALQVVIMYGAMIAIIGYGTYDQGGLAAVWETATAGNRTVLVDWDTNPTTRHTFWTLVVGGYFTWITIYGVNQAQVQRYLCVREHRMARNALWINLVGLFILMLTCSFGGLVIFKKYATCDPVKSGLVSKDDQLLPLFVMDTIGTWRGVPGLFVAGIFSGALSTVSSGMNSLAAITLEDFFKGGCTRHISEKHATMLSKGLSLMFGVVTFGLVFVAEQLGDILSAALGIFGIIGGPLCGAFTLGMFFPWANSIGAFCGTIFGLLFTLFIGTGYQVLSYTKVIKSSALPVFTHECTGNITETLVEISQESSSWVNSLREMDPDSAFIRMFQVSYLWYSAIGIFSVVIVGMIVSFFTGLNDIKSTNPDTLSPLIHWIKHLLPGGDHIGDTYDEEGEEKGLEPNKSTGSLSAAFTNMAYTEKEPPVRNGHIEESSRL